MEYIPICCQLLETARGAGGAEGRATVTECLYEKCLEKVFFDWKKQVEKYILTGQRVWNLMINTDGTKLYTTNGVSNDISVIDIDKRKVIKSIPVGRYPWGVAVKD